MLTDEQLTEIERTARVALADPYWGWLRDAVFALVAEVRRLKACPAAYPPFGLPAELAVTLPFEPAHAVTAYDDGFVTPPAVTVDAAAEEPTDGFAPPHVR